MTMLTTIASHNDRHQVPRLGQFRRQWSESCLENRDDIVALSAAFAAKGFSISDQDIAWAYRRYCEDNYEAGWMALVIWKHLGIAVDELMQYLEPAD